PSRHTSVYIRTQSLSIVRSTPVIPGFSLSFGISAIYISLVILLPISALLIYVSGMTWSQYWFAISDVRLLQSYKVTLSAAFYSTVVVTAIGFLWAWIITRYDFPGRRLLASLVDLPFALPPSVAGVTLSTLFTPSGGLGQFFDMVGIKISYAFPGIVVAMVFASIP